MNRETFQHRDMQRITPPNPSFRAQRALEKKETEKMKKDEGRDGRQQQNKAL